MERCNQIRQTVQKIDYDIKLNEEKEENKIEKINVNASQVEVLDFKSDEKFSFAIWIFTLTVKLQQKLLKEEKQILTKILEEIQQYSCRLCQFQKYKAETQAKLQNNFNVYLLQFITNYENLQWIGQDLQKENENSRKYFDRLKISLDKVKNENEKICDENNSNYQISIYDFLNELKGFSQEQSFEKGLINEKITFEQELFIQKFAKIYQLDNQDKEMDDELNQQQGFFETMGQKYQDFKNNDEWKIKQGLIFTIIQISSNCFSDTIIEFCQQALIQIWTLEKDQRVRNLLKNQDLIAKQVQILQKDWRTQQDRISSQMQQMLRKIDDLQEQIFHEANLTKRDQQLIELDETTQQLDEYIENISEMGQQLKLITDFVNHIRKGLNRVEAKINQMKDQLKSMSDDIKSLRGKSVQQLLEIRKWKVLKEAAQKNVKTIYVPLKSQDKTKRNTNNLMNLEQFDDLSGEVNKFLLKENETVLLIHGVAGSGKSTVAKKIEEFVWKLNESNIKVNEYVLVPIYISLPSVKNPAFQIIEEALRQDEYGFDDLQLKECKELLEIRKFRLLILMDSYDEMKLENIKKNIYIINKLYSNWSNPLVIFTTRSEILTSSNYSDWFAPEDKAKLKEIQILKFDQIQKKEYIKQFTYLSIKVLIFEIYEWQTKMLNQISMDLQKFELFWHKFQTEFLKQSPLKTSAEILLQKKQIEEIILFLKNDQLISLQSNEALRRLDINLQKLWSVEKYEAMIKMINLDKLIDTPYMMEIIVQVLPQMLAKVTEILKLKQNFIKNLSKKIQELLMSLYLIKLYQNQNLKSSNLLKNAQDEQTPDTLKFENHQQDQYNKQDIEVLTSIDYIQLSIEIWNILEQNQFFSQFQLSEINELNQKLNYIFDFNNIKNILFQFEVIKKVPISNERIAKLICDSLREQNLTSYDFYEEFISQYHFRQIEKQRNLGKSINTDRFLYDLQKYSIKLAKQMSIKEVTQVQYKQQGFLYKDETDENKWLNEFFNDDGQDGHLKKDIRSCSFVKQKGGNFQFVHKSISEFMIASDIFEVLIATKDIEKSCLERCIKILETEQVKDCVLFLEKHVSQKHYEMCIQNNNLSLYEKQKQLDVIESNFKKITTILRIIKQHDLSSVNYSTQSHRETRKFLIQKIQKEETIIQFLQFIVHLTALDDGFIQSGSNCINFLVEMKIDLTRQSFRNIKIKNTTLYASNFAFSDLSGSEFENVNIDGINLNGTLLYNCKWNNLQIYELHKIIGHKGSVYSICFTSDGKFLASASEDKSIILWDVKLGQDMKKLKGHTEKVSTLCIAPDDSILASGSFDRSIRLWNIETGQQRFLLEGHNDFVQSLCFSPDGATLASGSYDCSLRLWDVKSGLEKLKLDGHKLGVYSVCFSPDGNTLASGSGDKVIRLWSLKTGLEKKKLEGHSGCIQSVKFSPDGATLASGSEDKSIRIWDIRLGQVKQIFEGHQNWIRSICFSPDGNILASGSQDKSIRIWDLRSGQERKRLEGHRSWISTVCFSPDGTTLASGGGDQLICLWDVRSDKNNQKQQGKINWVFSVCFSPDGTILASGNGDNSIRLWDAKSGQEKNNLEGHRSWVYSICFSPDGTLLASGSDDKSIRLWDVESGQQKNLLELHTQEIYSICFSPDGNTLASGGEDKSILLWDLKLWKQKIKLEGINGSVLSVCFSPDGLILASGCGDNSILLWDMDSGQQKLKLEGHNERVYSVCFSSFGDILASSSHDQSIRLWRVASGEEIKKIEGNSRSVCFSPDGTLLAFASWSYSISIWDLNLMQELYILEGHNDSVSQINFSPDSNLLVSSSYDKSIRLWDVSQKQDKKLQLRAISACLSPDGTTLATGCLDKLIRLWDLKSGDQKMKLIGHNQRVESVTFSPDGAILASGSFDASIYLWDTKSGNLKIRINGHSKSVLSLQFSPKGTILASGSLDGSLRLWDVNSGSEKLKLRGLTNQVQILCFSSDGTVVAQGALDKSINMWDINLEQQLSPSDSGYQEIFYQLQPNIEENLLQKKKFYDCLTVLRISQYEHCEAKGTQILQGQFINHFKMDLRRLFQQKGSIILEEQRINI
ncbi:unnamed protein product (macronuclear) [Paramecium tetraurelia]|uniref:NB-ARC domain-containing protein n=1 Tax=Paramecium tetraurelia TaxID=5888 RepID=A0DA29_PARTE|nr:uncharacterized protein GSPATT00014828001 [Paramecium tetraurelia]CAK79896.1 unnamed protein product [Paramecium tetraurelia]|eukprot:XP_001447293.1 hypothetical protein (macronuclear) [Paramecium tetraurelia strain d4-2]